MGLHLLTTLASSQPRLLLTAEYPQVTTLIFWSTSTEVVILDACGVLARQILSKLFSRNDPDQLNSKSVIIKPLLEQVIRPAFMRSRPRNITAAGRKAINPLQQALTSSEDDKILKAWRFSQKYVVDVLFWVIESSDVQKGYIHLQDR